MASENSPASAKAIRKMSTANIAFCRITLEIIQLSENRRVLYR
jgi:hypothetical protein